MVHSQRAMVLTLGWILSCVTPTASAENSCRLPPSLKAGRMAMAKNTMPRPPIQWVSARQKRMACDCVSMSSMMVAPVVVKPDIVSKNALPTVGTLWLKRNGSMPKALNNTHVSAATQ